MRSTGVEASSWTDDVSSSSPVCVVSSRLTERHQYTIMLETQWRSTYSHEKANVHGRLTCNALRSWCGREKRVGENLIFKGCLVAKGAITRGALHGVMDIANTINYDSSRMVRESSPWGRLTQVEVRQCLPPNTLPTSLRSWAELHPAILQLTPKLQARIRDVAEAKETGTLERKREAARKSQAKQRERCQLQREADARDVNVNDNAPFRLCLEEGDYMKLPTSAEVRTCLSNFRQATGNEALKRCVCAVCARLLPASKGMEHYTGRLTFMLTLAGRSTPSGAPAAERANTVSAKQGTCSPHLVAWAVSGKSTY